MSPDGYDHPRDIMAIERTSLSDLQGPHGDPIDFISPICSIYDFYAKTMPRAIYPQKKINKLEILSFFK